MTLPSEIFSRIAQRLRNGPVKQLPPSQNMINSSVLLPTFPDLLSDAPSLNSFGIQAHPFLNESNFFRELVTYRGNVFVPSKTKTKYTLHSNGTKKYLTVLGSISKFMKIPRTYSFSNTVQDVCSQAEFYYRNSQFLEMDLRRFTDTQFRKQYFEDFFSKPFYIKDSSVFEQGALSKQTCGLFEDGNCKIAFEQTPQTLEKIKRVMAPSFDIYSKLFSSLGYFNYSRSILSTHNPKLHGYDVTFTTYIPSHKTKAIAKTFTFDNAHLNTIVSFGYGQLNLHDYPRVTTPNYKHFFVHSDGEICYNGFDRFEEIGLTRGVWYSLQDKLIGYKLARVLGEGISNLIDGYKPNCRPVYRPESLLELAS